MSWLREYFASIALSPTEGLGLRESSREWLVQLERGASSEPDRQQHVDVEDQYLRSQIESFNGPRSRLILGHLERLIGVEPAEANALYDWLEAVDVVSELHFQGLSPDLAGVRSLVAEYKDRCPGGLGQLLAPVRVREEDEWDVAHKFVWKSSELGILELWDATHPILVASLILRDTAIQSWSINDVKRLSDLVASRVGQFTELVTWNTIRGALGL